MPASPSATIDIIVSAFRKLGVIGAPQREPYAEDTELALNEFNEIVEMWNLRKRKAYFQRKQEWLWGQTKDSYTIGPAAADPAQNPDFVVDHGMRPVKLEFARLILTNNTVYPVYIPIAIIQLESYQTISVPKLASNFPLVLYYVASWPNGTIYPYPANPRNTWYGLELTWWQQLETVAMEEITIPLVLPFGYRRALALSLAEACWLAFPKKTDLEELQRQARIARAEIEAPNVPPPKTSTRDGMGLPGSTMDWRSRTFV
jgi:hypothetical protein